MSIGITGMGAITALGNSVQSSWDALIAGETGVHALTRCAPIPGYAAAAAEVDIALEPYQDRLAALAIHAADEAMTHAGFLRDYWPPLNRLAIVIGTSLLGMQSLVDSTEQFRIEGPRRLPPWSLPAVMSNGPAAALAVLWQATGPVFTINTACASGIDAIGLGCTLLRDGQADVVLVGGAEAAIVPWILAAAGALRALANDKHVPEEACRPWDSERTGTVLGEGAGMVVLERRDDAERRGAPVLAVCEKYHSACKAASFVAPDVESIQRCLEATRAPWKEAQGLCFHGSSTGLGDTSEMEAIAATFDPICPYISAWGTKGAFGHTLAAGGAIDVIMATQALRAFRVPPTRNLYKVDSRAPGLILERQSYYMPLSHIQVLAMGFGGHHAVLRLGASHE